MGAESEMSSIMELDLKRAR